MADLRRFVKYNDIALSDIKLDPVNSIHDAIESNDRLPEFIINAWVNNEPAKAGEYLFTLLDDLLETLTEIKS